LTKPTLIYSVSCFNLGWLGALFGKAKPTEAPRGDGIGLVRVAEPFLKWGGAQMQIKKL